MLRTMLLRFWKNLGTLLLALAIAFAVWISAVVAADPNEERDFPTPLALQVRGLGPGLVLLGNLPTDTLLRLSAPVSLWDRLTSRADTVEVFIDVTGLESGEHTVPIEVDSELGPFRVVQVLPSEVNIQLEPLVVRQLEIEPQVQGTPALGFELHDATVTPAMATVSGPANLVNQMVRLVARLNVNDARQTLTSTVDIQALDGSGSVLSGLTIDPAQADIEQTIAQAGGYRDIAVNVETVGQPAGGFRVTSISVDPPIVTLFSTDTQIVAGVPGFVSTEPLDLSSAKEDIVARLALILPQGVIIVGGQQNVEVSVGIAPIETSILLNVNVEVIGIATGFGAELSPRTASVVVSGPLATLQSLTGADIRLFVDVSGLEPGTHLIEPQAEVTPADVRLISVNPSSIEVVITQQ
ncbi:MAG: CdaR family protein [Anaerolineales bacterium]